VSRQAELLADQVAQALAGDHAHAGAHLLHHNQRDGDGNDGPQKGVAVLRACLGVGEDAAGVVIDVGRNESGPRTAKNSMIRIRQRLAMPAGSYCGVIEISSLTITGRGARREV